MGGPATASAQGVPPLEALGAGAHVVVHDTVELRCPSWLASMVWKQVQQATTAVLQGIKREVEAGVEVRRGPQPATGHGGS